MRITGMSLLILLMACIALAACRASAEAVTPTNGPAVATETPVPSSTTTPTATPQPSPTSAPIQEPFLEPVTLSPAPGEHVGPLTISMNADSASTAIRYTLDGSDPAADSALNYEEPFIISESVTIRAIAIYENGFSGVTTGEYTVTLSRLDAPSISHSGGAFVEPQVVEITSNEPGATTIYTLDGSTPTTDNGITYTGPVTIDESATIKTTVTRPGFLDSEVREATFRIYDELVESDEDIVLGPGDRMVIEDTLYRHRGDIRLTGDAQLVIKNSMLRHLQDFAFEHSLEAHDSSSIVVENSGIGTDCNGSFNWSFFDDSSMLANGMDPAHAGCNTWSFMSGESDITVSEWDTFSGTVCGASTVYVANSDTLEVELCFPENSRVNTKLPTVIEQFTFDSRNASNANFSLELRDVTINGWGINVLPGSEITIRDSEAITIGVIVGYPWQSETVTLSGLRRGHYDEQFWQIGPDAGLRLVNTTVYGWEPNVFADNTLIIKGSDYTASAVNSGHGHYEIENSTVNLLSTNESVTMTVTGSTITGDVIASGDSVITLIDCIVEGTVYGDNDRTGGNVIARDNGRVILQDTTVLGETVTHDNGEVTVEEAP